MGKNFADFNYQPSKNSEEKNHSTVVSEQDIAERYQQLKDLDCNSLQAKLFEEVASQKANGTFNYQLLQSSLQSMQAFLPPENYQNLARLLESIK